MEGWNQTLWSQQADGPALTNSTTATSLIGTTVPKWTFSPGFFDKIGKKFQFKASGRISTVVTTPGTLTLDLRFGSIVIANGGAMTLSTTAKTNVSWEMVWELTLRAIGQSTSANFMHQGRWTSEAAGATTVAGEAKSIMLPQSAPAVGTGFDSSASNVIDLFGTWSVANASNSILVHQAEIISLN
jgi:hypothetical protein